MQLFYRNYDKYYHRRYHDNENILKIIFLQIKLLLEAQSQLSKTIDQGS